ncbi:MAG: peptide deformylase, partial [Actinomycetota bacterium]
VGLAAPQVGRSIRVMVFDVGDGPRTLANPELISLEGEQLGEEGCLSLPGLYAPVQRALRVRCEALDIDGKPVVIEADELLARVLQHEVDHIDGILFIDRLDEEVRAEVFAQLRQQQFGIAPPPPDPARAL